MHYLIAQAGTPGATGASGVTGARGVAPVGLPFTGGSLDPIWIYLFLAALGIGASLPTLVYAVKTRGKPAAMARAFAGGGIFSTAAAALGAKVSGLSSGWTYAEAAVFAGFWFIVGAFLWMAALLALLYWQIVRPLELRFGAVQGVRAWLEFFDGVESLGTWIRNSVRAVDGDAAWDEFSCAALEVHAAFSELVEPADAVIGWLGATDREVPIEMAMEAVQSLLEDPVAILTSRLYRTHFNFTVWRVHAKDDTLEHLATFPAEGGKRAGQKQRLPFKIWSTPAKTSTGSLAALSLFERRYLTMRPHELRPEWEPRQLGKSYDEIGCMPIPCDGGTTPAWGCVCVESRGGSIPLGSKAIRLLLGEIARVMDSARDVVAVRGVWDGQIRLLRDMLADGSESPSDTLVRPSPPIPGPSVAPLVVTPTPPPQPVGAPPSPGSGTVPSGSPSFQTDASKGGKVANSSLTMSVDPSTEPEKTAGHGATLAPHPNGQELVIVADAERPPADGPSGETSR